MSKHWAKKHCQIDEASRNLLESDIDKLGLSARAFNRILKIARTIANLQAESNLRINHISSLWVCHRSAQKSNRLKAGIVNSADRIQSVSVGFLLV
jgi:magnesium chelatase family protein